MIGLEHYLTVAAALLVPCAAQAEVTLSGGGKSLNFTCNESVECDDVVSTTVLFDDSKNFAPRRLPVLSFGPAAMRAVDVSALNRVTYAVQSGQLPYDLGRLSADGQGL